MIIGPFEMILGIVVIGVGGGVLSDYFKHRSKVAEAKIKSLNKNETNLKDEIKALRDEVKALRDTTMQYDLSFDTALERLEQRVEHLERPTRIPVEATDEPNVLRGGR